MAAYQKLFPIVTSLNKTAVSLGTFRFALAILVIANHTQHYPESWPNIGSIAVAVFFFISGFLMPLTFELNYKFTAFGDRAVRFWANRALKIYPWYWLSILAPLALVFFRGANNEAEEIYFYPTVLLQNALLLGLNQEQLWGQYLRYNNPAWSLDVELQYYLLVPALVWGYSKFPKFLTTFMIGASALSIYLLIAPTEKIYIDRSLLPWVALFFGGFLYFQAHLEKFSFRTKNFALVGILVS